MRVAAVRGGGVARRTHLLSPYLCLSEQGVASFLRGRRYYACF